MKKYIGIKYISYFHLIIAIFLNISSQCVDWRLTSLTISFFWYVVFNELQNRKS